MNINYITKENKVYAIIVPKSFSAEGIEFFTPENFSQQLGYMKRPKGYVVAPHTHTLQKREVLHTQEVLILRKGRAKIGFYDENNFHFSEIIISSGDVILLAFGGHDIEMLEECEIIEVKQGPYISEFDKTYI